MVRFPRLTGWEVVWEDSTPGPAAGGQGLPWVCCPRGCSQPWLGAVWVGILPSSPLPPTGILPVLPLGWSQWKPDKEAAALQSQRPAFGSPGAMRRRVENGCVGQGGAGADTALNWKRTYTFFWVNWLCPSSSALSSHPSLWSYLLFYCLMMTLLQTCDLSSFLNVDDFKEECWGYLNSRRKWEYWRPCWVILINITHSCFYSSPSCYLSVVLQAPIVFLSLTGPLLGPNKSSTQWQQAAVWGEAREYIHGAVLHARHCAKRLPTFRSSNTYSQTGLQQGYCCFYPWWNRAWKNFNKLP